VWTDRQDVREALHVSPESSWNNVDGGWPEYVGTASDLGALYTKWLNDTDTDTASFVL